MIKVKIPFKTRWGLANQQDKDRLESAMGWCQEKFGKPFDPSTKKYRWMNREIWDGWSGRYYTYFYFTNEEHATWFILRWS